jgi:UDP-glucose 4-epimerase
VQNAILLRTTRISGSPDTIRDYILADDIGRFIADQLVGSRPEAKTHILANGKPTSMTELIAIVQDKVHRRLYFRYEAKPSNARNISFRPSCMPKHWRATPLAIGVALTAARVADVYRGSTDRPRPDVR